MLGAIRSEEIQFEFLNYTVSGGEEIVPHVQLPGTILSTDDFLRVSSGLVTTEMTLYIYNTSPASQLFEGARVVAAGPGRR